MEIFFNIAVAVIGAIFGLLLSTSVINLMNKSLCRVGAEWRVPFKISVLIMTVTALSGLVIACTFFT